MCICVVSNPATLHVMMSGLLTRRLIFLQSGLLSDIKSQEHDSQ